MKQVETSLAFSNYSKLLASRGTSRSTFIVQTLTVASGLAITACIVLLLTNYMGPFIQQSAAIVSVPQHTNETASVLTFSAGRTFHDFHIKGDTTAQTRLSRAYLWGSAISPSTQPFEFITCETGNCTFPNYRSLAVCSTCVNITDRIEVRHPSTNKLISEEDCRPNKTKSADKLDCRYTLPGGPSVQYATLLNASQERTPVDTIARLGGFAAISSLYVKPNSRLKPRSSVGLADYAAEQCGLSFCSHLYSTSMTLRKWRETTLATLYSSNSTRHDHCMIYNETLNLCLYRVGDLTQAAWTNGIYEIYNGNVTRTPTSNMDNSPDFSGIVMEGLYHDNLSISFASVAIALTKRVRTVEWEHQVQGHAFRNVPYFQASMYWLIYPGTVILLACILMAMISIKAVRYPI